MSRRTNKKRKDRTISGAGFDGPAKQGDGQTFVIERFNEGSTGTKRRYRNIGEHPLTLAHERGQISAALFAAGSVIRVLLERLARSGKDSTQALDRSDNSASAVPFTQSQVDAVRQLKKIEAAMSGKNYRIVRHFCGDGRSAVEAVQRVTSCHPSGVKYRLIEALEDLEEAIEATKLRIVA